MITGDNLGLNSILGFIESFNATRSCRICIVGSEDLKKMFQEDASMLRTKENYLSTFLAQNPSATGVTENCIFNDVKTYHITVNITLDALHDFGESVCVFTLESIVQHLVKQKLLDLNVINTRLEKFKFVEFEENPPPKLKALKIEMSAAECFCFRRYFGILFFDLILEEDEYWALYLFAQKNFRFHSFSAFYATSLRTAQKSY